MNKSKFYAELIIIMEYVFAHTSRALAWHLINFCIQIYTCCWIICKLKEREKKSAQQTTTIFTSTSHQRVDDVLSVCTIQKCYHWPKRMVTHTHTRRPKQVLRYIWGYTCIVNVHLWFMNLGSVFAMIVQFRKLNSHVITNFLFGVCLVDVLLFCFCFSQFMLC